MKLERLRGVHDLTVKRPVGDESTSYVTVHTSAKTSGKSATNGLTSDRIWSAARPFRVD